MSQSDVWIDAQYNTFQLYVAGRPLQKTIHLHERLNIARTDIAE